MAYFSNYDVFICLSSLLTYVADAITDVTVIIFFFLEGHAIWGSMSLCFVAVATLLMQIFSFHWHVTDKTVTWKKFILHILFLAPIHRYLSVLRLGLSSRKFGRKEDLNAAYRGLNDVSILRLFETFVESAPQLLLQLYIITSDVGNIDPLVGVSCVFSLLSVAWAVTAYTDALHLAYKKVYKRSAMSLVTHASWQTGMITSRVCAIVLFATVFHALVAAPLALHAVAMVVWIMIIKPEFGSNMCEKGLFTVVAAIVHTFCFLNLKDGNSRWRMLFFYIVSFVENTVFLCLWYSFKGPDQPAWLDPVAFTAVFGGFVLGMVSLFTYYCCCHPSGPVPIEEKEKYTVQRTPAFKQNEPLANNKPIFNTSSSSAAMVNQWLHASLDLTKEGLIENPDNYLDTDLHRYQDGQPLANNKQPIFNTSSSSAAMVNQWLHASLDLTKEGLIENPDNYLDTNLHTYQDGQPVFSPHGYNDNLARNISNPGSVASEDRKARNNIEACRNGRRNRSRTLDSNIYDTTNASTQEQYSLPSSVIIDLFSRSNLSPGNYSTLSLNRSGSKPSAYDGDNENGSYSDRNHSELHDERVRQNRFIGSGDGSALNRNGNKLAMYEKISPVVSASMDYIPAKISPLDPYKLLEESQSMNVTGSVVRERLGSDEMMTGGGLESTPVLHVQPDVTRGITRLSLSYSPLDHTDGPQSLPADRRCYNYSSENSALMHSHLQKKSPVYPRLGLRKSDEITFSNMSLPLPDSSLQSRLSKSQTSDQHLSRSKLSLSSGRCIEDSVTRSKKKSPLYNVIKNRSVDSFYTNSPIDRQLSYLSDHGLSTSDQVLSVTDSSTNRSRRSLTSSGFQSEETTYSSPGHMPGGHAIHSQFQSTPIVENEISSIQDLPSSVRVQRPRESLDADVNIDKVTPKMENLRNLPNSDKMMTSTENQRQFMDRIMYSDSLEQLDSPSLPPLTVSSLRSSSTGSGNSSRFFKNLIDDAEMSDNMADQSVDSSDVNVPSVGQDRRTRYSTHNEQSSLSEFLSNISSSQPGNGAQSDQSISMCSDYDKYKEALSLPSMPTETYQKSTKRFSDPTIRHYENLESFPVDDRYVEGESVGDSINNSGGSANTSKEQQLPYNDPMNRTSLHANSTADQLEYAPVVENYENSPKRLGRSPDVFNRDKWRASLDKETKERLVKDMEKYAPRKLYELRAKNDPSVRKRVSPLTINEYNDSPYKFRRGSERQPDYVNIENVSPDSLSSAYEHVNVVTPGVYTDYENVYNLNSVKMNNCPLVRPESLSDSLILGDHAESIPHDHLKSGNLTNLDRGGFVVSEPCDSRIVTTCSPLSVDTSGTKSPINTTGVNSAFKPVKPRGRFDCMYSSLDSSDKSHNSSANCSGNSADHDSSRNETGSQVMDRNTESPLFIPNQTRDLSCTACSNENVSQQLHSIDSSLGSTFDTRLQSFDVTGQTPVNYLKLAGRAPFSFSMAYNPVADVSSRNSSHSYSNSIPWEDPENISTSFQSSRSGSIRQPLKSLENTPVISPIYGIETKPDPARLARKRFMSTPILTTNLDGKGSKTPGQCRTPGGTVINTGTPRRRSSRQNKNVTFGEDTSTWSSHSVSGQEWAHEPNERSSLSKTTYI